MLGRYLHFIISFIVGLAPVIALSQAKVQRSGAFWPELQAEYVFKSTSFLSFRNQYRHNFEDRFNYLSQEGPLKFAERVQFRASFEHMFSSHWSTGISEAYAFEPTRRILFNEIFARHLGKIGNFQFSNRASVEHIVQWGRENYARFRFRTDLDKNISLAGKNIRPRISYELFFNHDYNANPALVDVKRRVDRTRFRMEVQYPVSDYFSVIPFFTRQTDYFVVEPTYDAANTITKKGGNQNFITPIWGLDLRYTFFKGGKAFPRTIRLNNNI